MEGSIARKNSQKSHMAQLKYPLLRMSAELNKPHTFRGKDTGKYSGLSYSVIKQRSMHAFPKNFQ